MPTLSIVPSLHIIAHLFQTSFRSLKCITFAHVLAFVLAISSGTLFILPSLQILAHMPPSPESYLISLPFTFVFFAPTSPLIASFDYLYLSAYNNVF